MYEAEFRYESIDTFRQLRDAVEYLLHLGIPLDTPIKHSFDDAIVLSVMNNFETGELDHIDITGDLEYE